MTDKIKKIAMTNTKKEMLEAYNELAQQIKEQQELQLNPQKISEVKTKKEVIKKVEGINLDSVAKGVNALKSEINSSLNILEQNLENEVKKYEDIRNAIDVKENELKEVFEIEKSAYSLAALIESQNQKKIEFDEEMEYKKSTILKEIDNLRAEWEREKEEHDKIVKERDEKEKKEAARQKEEFEYNFKREKQIAKDNLDDELKSKEKEFNERENNLKSREVHLSELEQKVGNLQADINEAVAKAVGETRTKLQEEYKNKDEYRSKEFEGEKNVLITKIESYEKIVKEQEQKIKELSVKIDDAYTKVQDVAVKTIESASNTKAFSELQKALNEKFSSKGNE